MAVELTDIPLLYARPRKRTLTSVGAGRRAQLPMSANNPPEKNTICLVTGRRDRMAGRPWPWLIIGRNMTAGDVDALIYVRRCDEGDERCECVLVCEICQGVGGIGRPRAGWPAHASTRLRSSSSYNTVRKRFRSPSNTALSSASSPLPLSPSGWQAQASDHDRDRHFAQLPHVYRI